MRLNIILYRDFGSDLLSTVGGAVEGGIGGLIGQGMGLMMQGEQNANQISQQQKLTNMQVAANEQLSDYNYANQLKMWQNTNFPAQVSELNQAGLNPALLYGKGGMGAGGTTGTPTTGTGMGIAPNQGIQASLQAQEIAAQTRLTMAQANKIEAETPSGGAGTLGNATLENIQTNTQSLSQGVTESKARTALDNVTTQLEQYKSNIANVTQEAAIKIMNDTARQISALANSAEIQNTIDAKTQGDKIATIMYNMTNAYLENPNIKAQTGLAQSQTNVNDQIAKLAAQYAQIAWMNANSQRLGAGAALTAANAQKQMADLQTQIQKLGTSKAVWDQINNTIHALSGAAIAIGN